MWRLRGQGCERAGPSAQPSAVGAARRRPRSGLQAGPARQAGKSPQGLLPVRARPCAARSRGPRQNSLRELRSLRSDNCRESVHEARWRARPRPCAARRRPFAPGPTRPQPCGQPCAAFEAHAGHRRLQARGRCPDGAHWRRRAAQCSEGKPGVPAGPASRGGRVQRCPRWHRSRPRGASSAAHPRARAATAKPRRDTASGPRQRNGSSQSEHPQVQPSSGPATSTMDRGSPGALLAPCTMRVNGRCKAKPCRCSQGSKASLSSSRSR